MCWSRSPTARTRWRRARPGRPRRYARSSGDRACRGRTISAASAPTRRSAASTIPMRCSARDRETDLMSASTSPTLSPLAAEAAGYDHVIPATAPWSRVVRRGQILRIVDLEGQQAVDTLFYNAHDYRERYSAQDTLLA